MFKNLSLKSRLIIFVSIGIIITSLIFTIYSTNMQKELFADSFTKKISGSLESVKLGIEIAFSKDEENYTIINKIFVSAKENKELDFIVLTYAEQDLIAAYPDSINYSFNELLRLSENPSFNDPVYVMQTEWKAQRGFGKIFIGFKTEQVQEYEKNVLVDTVFIVGLFLIISTIAVFLFASTITKPLQKLKQISNKISSGSYESRAVEDKGGSEIISVSKSFNHMVDELLATQNELEADIKEAADFVESLLPLPIKKEAVEIDWKFSPSKNLGGDSFGYHYLDDNNLAVYLIDVSGHGVGSALHSISVLNVIRNQSLPNTNFYSPSEVMSALNNIFQMEKHGDKYFTIWYGVLNINTMHMKFSSAGHPPAIICNTESNEISELKSKNFFIGAYSNVEFNSNQIELKSAQKLYVFSDGLYEFVKPDGKPYKFSELKNQIAEVGNRKANNLDYLITSIKKSTQTGMFLDDCSVISIFIK